jgi:hypothetical protein
MMMRLAFKVKYVDGQQVTVTSRPATEVAFERRYDRTIGSLFADFDPAKFEDESQRNAEAGKFMAGIHSEYMYFLAWHAARSEKTYDEWLELIDEVDWEFADSPGPTPPAP